MSAPAGRLFAVRHGETAWSRSGQHTGTTDIPLTDRGRELAKSLRPVMSRQSFARVLTSPLLRARETCALSGLGDRATIDPDLVEWDYGRYEGLTPAEIREQAPAWQIFRDGCPGGESPGQVGERVDRVIARVRGVEGDVVLFAHGHLLRVLVARWIGLPPEAGEHFMLDTATLDVLGYYRGVPAIVVWNAAVIQGFGMLEHSTGERSMTTYLLVNTGSSSVKLTVWSNAGPVKSQSFGRDDVIDLAEFAAPHGRVDAVVHRIVHANEVQRHALITPSIEAAIRDASPLAPLHNPIALHYIALSRAAFSPATPQLAAIDTAFFADLPPAAAAYALPPEIGPVRRYGFHGLAHAFMSRRCVQLDEKKPRRVVTLQLGAGCSAAAVMDGRAVDTSMGFSPSEGLMMASRSGDVDPGLLVHLLRTGNHSADDLDRAINQCGGLLGMCGHSAMPEVLRLAAAGEPRASLALDLYCYRTRKFIGAYAAVLGGLDAVVFGGGVGENALEVRRRILESLAWIGLELDRARNRSNPADAAITSAASRASAWVIHVDEASEMARIAADLLHSEGSKESRDG